MLQTIEKVSDVLALFDRQRTELGVREVAEALKLPKSSAHDLLSSLARTGLLNRTATGRYRLGWRLVTLSETLLATAELRREAHPVMEQIATQHQATVHLAILDDTKVVYVAKRESKEAVHLKLTSLGTRLHAHCTALGKMLLAHVPESEVERIVGTEGLPQFTTKTITAHRELARALAQIRNEGCAYDLEEILSGLCCVSALIRDHTDDVIGAISVSVPAQRFQRSQTELRKAIVGAAEAVSERLGHYAA